VSASYSAIVFGKGPVAIHAATLLREVGAHIELIVPSSVELSTQPSLRAWAVSEGIPVAATSDLDGLGPLSADLGISVFFDRIFRQRHIDQFGRLLNVHNSLLPRHRGVRPINWALRSGDTRHGVTLHEIDAGVDTGPVLAQESFRIDPATDEVADVYDRCLSAAQQLLSRTVSGWRVMHATAQEGSSATVHESKDDELLGDRRYWRRTDTKFTL
jgi:methionyl-tRNA formyltransferase